jgi:hypothetical protein
VTQKLCLCSSLYRLSLKRIIKQRFQHLQCRCLETASPSCSNITVFSHHLTLFPDLGCSLRLEYRLIAIFSSLPVISVIAFVNCTNRLSSLQLDGRPWNSFLRGYHRLLRPFQPHRRGYKASISCCINVALHTEDRHIRVSGKHNGISSTPSHGAWCFIPRDASCACIKSLDELIFKLSTSIQVVSERCPRVTLTKFPWNLEYLSWCCMQVLRSGLISVRQPLADSLSGDPLSSPFVNSHKK